jgi:DNA-binding transcriptional LysR family regulator
MADRLRELEWFLTVHEERGFSAAARRLGVPQSAVSRAVANLEGALGVTLLTRTTRAVAPTEAGSLLAERVRHLVRWLAETEDLVTHAQAVPQGRVVVSAPVNYGRYRLVPHLAPLLRAYPGLTVEVRLQDRSIDLWEEPVDLAIRLGGVDGPGVRTARLGWTVRKLVAAPAWVARWGPAATVEDLLARPFVTFLLGDTPAPVQIRTADGPDRITPSGQVAVSDLGSARDLALAGLGAAQLPCFLVNDLIAAGDLVEVAPALWPAPTEIRCLWREGVRTARLRAVVDHLRQAVGDELPS